MYANVELICRITQDLELKQSKSGMSYLVASVACTRPKKNDKGEWESDFFNIKAFGKQAEFIAQYFHKGQKVFITGRPQMDVYEKMERNNQHSQ